LEEADCVLAFGASLNRFTVKGGKQFSDSARIIQCDLHSPAIGSHSRVDLGIVGDAHLTATALLTELTDRSTQRAGFRIDSVIEELAAFDPSTEFSDASLPDAVDPRTLLLAIDDILPLERAVVVDGGHFSGFPCMYLGVPDPQGFILALDFGAVGCGLGAAIGAAVANPQRLTVAVIGDGGLMMSLSDLDTAVRYHLPLLILVLNDGAYGAEMHILRDLSMPIANALFENPDFAQVALAVGAEGVTVRTLDDLAALDQRLPSLERPLLVDCKINRDVCAAWFATAFTGSSTYGR
jgi:thiamine pyrophosphate-dependent acetolactate synthase large subunit-like protein